ncbi:protein held out wings isoform X9 [Megalopta genalis]|uniref:protein held out wings isoform X9 n=1 Tax=Megalopta genalis TaxID=115081 RepID=UPI003FD40713
MRFRRLNNNISSGCSGAEGRKNREGLESQANRNRRLRLPEVYFDYAKHLNHGSVPTSLPFSAKRKEIAKVRASLFQISGVKKEPLVLPEPEGEITTLTEKVYVPVKEHPDFNFVGRILGPRGMTAKQLEQETGCKIMVRGKGSMRDKKKEELNRGKPNWEHLTDELHVLLTVDDTENRATLKLARAVEEVKKLLVPVQADGEDELKKRQLMELAIINGTYRDSNTKVAAVTDLLNVSACDEEWRRVAAAAAETQRLLPGLATPMRTPSAPLGAPLILSPRISVPTTAASLLNGSGPPGSLLSAGDPHGLIYTPYADYANYAALAGSPLLTEYTTADHSALKKQKIRMCARKRDK